MKPTNTLIHFKNGSNSVLGLPIHHDDEGSEFVHYQGRWVHIADMPLEPHTHYQDHRGKTIPNPNFKTGQNNLKPKRVPVHHPKPTVPDIEAFKGSPQTPAQPWPEAKS